MNHLSLHNASTAGRRITFWLPLVLSLLLTCQALAGSGAAAAPPRSGPGVAVSVEKQTARVGERLRLTLKYNLPEGARLDGETAIDGLESLTDVKQTARAGEIDLYFLVDWFDTRTIGPFGLRFRDKDGAVQRIESTAISVTAESSLGPNPEAAALKPIQDIITTASAWPRYLPWIAAAVCLLTLLLVCWLWWCKRKQAKTRAQAEIEPPHVRAERELAHLEASPRFEPGAVKAFYFAFSEILRRYMEAIRHFPAAEMTLEEISRYCTQHHQDRDILPLLRQADLVKFADTIPSAECQSSDLSAARAYILRTGPMPAETPDIPDNREVRT